MRSKRQSSLAMALAMTAHVRTLEGGLARGQGPHTMTSTLALLLPLLLLLLQLAPLARATTREQYCALCSSNTMCLYEGVSSACGEGRFAHGVPAADQSVVVRVHNELRNRVATGQEARGSPGPQPPASNMMALVWDDEVASVAQRWADQCTYQHDSCRDVPGSYVGQNLYLRSQWPCSGVSDAANWTEATYAWYNEVVGVGPNEVRSFSGAGGVGHYTQLVWASTTRLGCGYSLYQNGDWCRQYYVCNYAPGGNYLGQPLYRQGAARSACPASAGAADPSLSGLCGASATTRSVASLVAPAPAPAAPAPEAPADDDWAADDGLSEFIWGRRR